MTAERTHEAFQAEIDANKGDEASKTEAMEIHAAIGQSAWTREEADPANGAKGYDARVAHRILLADPTVYVVIVSDTAPTKRNLKYVKKSGVMYYRKSSGGKWGRSVQQRFVGKA